MIYIESYIVLAQTYSNFLRLRPQATVSYIESNKWQFGKSSILDDIQLAQPSSCNSYISMQLMHVTYQRLTKSLF